MSAELKTCVLVRLRSLQSRGRARGSRARHGRGTGPGFRRGHEAVRSSQYVAPLCTSPIRRGATRRRDIPAPFRHGEVESVMAILGDQFCDSIGREVLQAANARRALRRRRSRADDRNKEGTRRRFLECSFGVSESFLFGKKHLSFARLRPSSLEYDSGHPTGTVVHTLGDSNPSRCRAESRGRFLLHGMTRRAKCRRIAPRSDDGERRRMALGLG